MASNVWISSSDSDDGLPSCSQYLRSQKSQDAEVSGYKSLMQRLEKPAVPIDIVASSVPLKKGSSNCVQTDPVVNKSSKQAKRQKKPKEVNALPEDDKENDKKLHLFKPEDLYKKLSCTLSYSVIELFSSKDIISTIQDSLPIECELIYETDPVVRWQLNIPAHELNEEHFVGLNQRVLVLKAEQLVNLVLEKKLNTSGFALSEWLLSVGAATSSSHIVCYGLKKFKQMLKRNKNRKYKNAVLGSDAKKPTKKNSSDQVEISEEDLPDIFVNIQLNYGVDIIVVENEAEFILLLTQITKAIAESPLKRIQRKDVQFVQGNSVKIDSSSGDGSRRAWRLMLEQLFSVSSDISSSIASHYPSFVSLMEAYARVNSSEGACLLSEIVVRRGFGTLQQSRRIGPELSKRIYKLFSTEDKDDVV